MELTSSEAAKSIKSEEHRKQGPHKQRYLVVFLLLLVFFSLGVIIFLLGYISNIRGYTGQIIDTIEVPAPIHVFDGESGLAWGRITTVDIFARREGSEGPLSLFDRQIIAPGSRGWYSFTISNPGTMAIEHYIVMSETDENNPKVPLLYRLKYGLTGSEYVGGDGWKAATEIRTDMSLIESGEKATYTLEWMWDHADDERDTAIGIQRGDPRYMLKIEVTAQYP